MYGLGRQSALSKRIRSGFEGLPGIKHSSLFAPIKMTLVKIFRIENVIELFLEPEP
jgi:hypothetical protein